MPLHKPKCRYCHRKKCPVVAGSRLALQLLPVKRTQNESSQSHGTDARVLFFLVTASLCQDQVICASTAFGRISHSGKNSKSKKKFHPGQKLQPFNCFKKIGARNCNCSRSSTLSLPSSPSQTKKTDCKSIRWKCISRHTRSGVHMLCPAPRRNKQVETLGRLL